MAVWRTPPLAPMEVLDGRGGVLGDGVGLYLFGEGPLEGGGGQDDDFVM